MGDVRLRSLHDAMTQIGTYGRRSASSALTLHDVRSFSASYSYNGRRGYGPDDFKSKTARGRSSSSANKGGGGWGYSDPVFQRKRRVATYKAYSGEGNVKGSLRRSFRWLNDRYTRAVYGCGDGSGSNPYL